MGMEEIAFSPAELAARARARVGPELIGRLSLAFMDLVSLAGRPLTGTSYAQFCEEQELPMRLVQRVHEASGLGRPQPEDPIHPLDQDLLGSARLGRMLGLDDGVLIRIARVYGENLRRIAQAEPEFYHDHVEGPLLASGMDEQQMREAASQLSDQLAGVVQRMLVALYTRHQERYTIDHLVSHIEAVVTEERPQRPPAMCFLDLAGYTRLTEERGDRAAAALASSLADLVEQVSLPHGGQPVKWLGDGVMFHFRRPGQAVVAALEMVERTPQAGLPPAPARCWSPTRWWPSARTARSPSSRSARSSSRASLARCRCTGPPVRTGRGRRPGRGGRPRGRSRTPGSRRTVRPGRSG